MLLVECLTTCLLGPDAPSSDEKGRKALESDTQYSRRNTIRRCNLSTDGNFGSIHVRHLDEQKAGLGPSFFFERRGLG